MKTLSLLLVTVGWGWLGQAPMPAIAQSDFILGDPPAAPGDVSDLPKGPRTKGVTGGFTVNIASREAVRSFYNSVYVSSDEVAMNSTADVPNCVSGNNATAFQEAVLRRINWFRTMAGVPAGVAFDTTFSAKSQKAALMMSAKGTLSHTPPTSWTCYTADGAEAAGKSNLALGPSGPDAITGYIWDPYANNQMAGHRRWLLYPQTQVMGTGDVPAQGGRTAANSTWIVDGNFGGPRPATRDPFVSWPPPGFVPYQVVFGRWSFSSPNANFTGATVFMRSNGVPLSVQQEPVGTGAGENSIVWIPAGLASDGSGLWSRPATNLVYSVTISNVVGTPTNQFSYTVTVFDPAVPGPDYQPPLITGTNQPGVGQSNLYTFRGLTNASGYQWRQTWRLAAPFADGAENGLTNFIVAADTYLYSVLVSGPVAAGSKAFHLAHLNPTPQILTLNRPFYVHTNSSVSFRSRLGIATSDEFARVQISRNGGLTWSDIYAQAGATPDEKTFAWRSRFLGDLAGSSLWLRFNFDLQPGSYWPYADPGYGWYLDEIALTNTDILLGSSIASTSVTNFLFVPAQAGDYALEVRPVLLNEFPLDWGPCVEVTAVAFAPPAVVLLKVLPLFGSQVRIDFSLQSGQPTGFRLLQADSVTGPWSNDAAAVLSTNVSGASWRYTTTVSGTAKRFYQVSSGP
jgi:uncharacterized protein YkwD